MKIKLIDALTLESEIYGSFRIDEHTGNSILVQKGIINKSIPITAKIKIEQQLGKSLKEALEVYRKDVKEIEKKVYDSFKEEIEKTQLEVEGKTEAERKFAFAPIQLKINKEINSLKEDGGLNNLTEIEIEIPEVKISIAEFEAKVRINGQTEIENKLEGDEHYPYFFTHFIQL